MSSRTVRAELLVEAKAKQRATQQKLRRLRKKGVNISTLDARLSASTLNTLNPRQLRSQIRRLDSFNSRQNNIIPGRKGAPLDGNMWRKYKAAEKLYNDKSTKFFDSVRGLNDPVLNTTLEQRLKDLSDSTRSGDYRSFNPFNRTAANITKQESLQKLYEQMLARVDSNYLSNEAKLQRRILNKMLARTGNKDLIKVFKEATDEELITVTQYTDFMDTLESSYAMAKSTSTDTPRYQSSVYEDNEEKIHEWAEWARRHLTNKDDSEQDADDSRPTKTRVKRDRYGRFIGSESLPDPTFARDKQGRFSKRS